MEELSHRIKHIFQKNQVYVKVCEWLRVGEHNPIGLVFVVLVVPSDFLIS